jgi:hypothetical protein
MLETQLKENTGVLRETIEAFRKLNATLLELKEVLTRSPSLAEVETTCDTCHEENKAPATNEISDNRIREIAITITKHFKQISDGRNAVIKLREHLNPKATTVLDLDQEQRAEFIRIAKKKGYVDD